MYSPQATASFAPRNFKNVIGKYGASFSGYQQQDSQEFLMFLLDGLQEDLNRIHKKPYIQKPDSTDEMVNDPIALKEMADKCWEIYKARNDSVITDLFAGMYKSTVVCPECKKVSIIFDPFSNLTLQLPIENIWTRRILVFPLKSTPVVIYVDIDKNASFKALKEYVAVRVGIDPKQTMVAELYKNAFYRIFSDSATISEATIVDSDNVCVWEFPGQPTNYPTPKTKLKTAYHASNNGMEEIPDDDSAVADRMLVPVFHRRLKGGQSAYRQNSVFGYPSFIVVDREEGSDHDSILRKVLARTEMMTTRDFLREENESELDALDFTTDDSDTALMTSDETSEVHAKSLESEDGMVDISMPNGHHNRQSLVGKEERPPEEKGNKRVPSMLKPGRFISPEVRSLFEMKVLPVSNTMIPVGISFISEERRDYPSLSSREPKPLPRPKTTLNKTIEERQAKLGESGPISDEDPDDVLPSTQVLVLGAGYTSDSEDGLPPVEQIVQPRIPPSTGFGTFNKSTPRNRKGLITYSRKDNRVASKVKPRKDKAISRETTPPESGPLLHLGESILVDWHPDAYDALFTSGDGSTDDEQMRGAPTWDNPPNLKDEELEEKRQFRANRKKNGITLDDCLEEFGKSETLSENDAWFCPRCREHRRASKTFELWKAPDILVIHLKRFSAQGRLRDKLDVHVDFPIEGLDLSTRLAAQEDGKSPIYDLFAVDNHYGGLGGGHYTAFARNFMDETWYEFNGESSHVNCGRFETLTSTDSSVQRRSDPAKSVVTPAAYLLFYRRRSCHPLGGPFFETSAGQNQAGKSSPQSTSRTGSPAGEGRRLDESSRTGSSSASRGAGATHQVGGGGSLDRTGVPITRKGIDDDDPADGLPLYSARDLRDTLDPRSLQEDTLESMEVDEDEGIAGMGESREAHPRWRGPVLYSSPPWSFNTRGVDPRHNSPHGSGEEGEGADEDLFADDSSTKVAKSSVSNSLENRMADFNDDEGTTSGVFGTPPPDTIPLLDVPGPVDEAEFPVADVMLDDDDLARDYGHAHGSEHDVRRVSE